MTAGVDDERTRQVVAATRAWLERVVIGLNLCPFAKAVHERNQIRYVVSAARSSGELLLDLKRELTFLAGADPEVYDTTLLIHPHALTNFLDYNDFLGTADVAVADLELDGVLQVASFHPDYQFAATSKDDITNYTNRSPYPTLHLLRESSMDRAVDGKVELEHIHSANIATIIRLGKEGWSTLTGDTKPET